jgi:hypothetical protein
MQCADCGGLMWQGSSSLPEGSARCRPCRRARVVRSAPKPPRRNNVCEWCRAPAVRRFCTLACANMAMRSAHPRARGDIDDRRAARDAAAPGLTQIQRARLRAKWIKQGRSCSYCSARCEQVDHVIPLARGGTNYEGNLAPVCAPCNRRKNAMLLVEWRMRGRAEWVVVVPPPRKSRPSCQSKPARQSHLCPMCNTPTMRVKYCGNSCAIEANARRTRDRYRISAGLCPQPWQPTTPRVLRAA